MKNIALIITASALFCVTVNADELQDVYKQYANLKQQGKYQEALPFAQEAVRLGEARLGKDDITTSIYLSDLALLY